MNKNECLESRHYREYWGHRGNWENNRYRGPVPIRIIRKIRKLWKIKVKGIYGKQEKLGDRKIREYGENDETDHQTYQCKIYMHVQLEKSLTYPYEILMVLKEIFAIANKKCKV